MLRTCPQGVVFGDVLGCPVLHPLSPLRRCPCSASPLVRAKYRGGGTPALDYAHPHPPQALNEDHRFAVAVGFKQEPKGNLSRSVGAPIPVERPIRVGVTLGRACPCRCPGTSRCSQPTVPFLSPTESPAHGSVPARAQGRQAAGGNRLLRPGPWSGRQREPGAGIRELTLAARGISTLPCESSLVPSRGGARRWDTCGKPAGAGVLAQHRAEPQLQLLCRRHSRSGGAETPERGPQTLLPLALPALAVGLGWPGQKP